MVYDILFSIWYFVSFDASSCWFFFFCSSILLLKGRFGECVFLFIFLRKKIKEKHNSFVQRKKNLQHVISEYCKRSNKYIDSEQCEKCCDENILPIVFCTLKRNEQWTTFRCWNVFNYNLNAFWNHSFQELRNAFLLKSFFLHQYKHKKRSVLWKQSCITNNDSIHWAVIIKAGVFFSSNI